MASRSCGSIKSTIVSAHKKSTSSTHGEDAAEESFHDAEEGTPLLFLVSNNSNNNNNNEGNEHSSPLPRAQQAQYEFVGSTLLLSSSSSSSSSLHLNHPRRLSWHESVNEQQENEKPTTGGDNNNNNNSNKYSDSGSIHSNSSSRLNPRSDLSGSLRAMLTKLTTSERDRTLRERPGLRQAAFLICDAIVGSAYYSADGAYDPYLNLDQPLLNAISLICHRWCSHRGLAHILHGAAWTLLLLTFIEPPRWCRTRNDNVGVLSDEGMDPYGGCYEIMNAVGIPADNSTTSFVEYYPNTHSMLLTLRQSLLVEHICISIISIFVLLQWGRDAFSIIRYLRPGPSQFSRIIQFVSLLLMILSMFTGTKGHHPLVRLLFCITFVTTSERDIRTLIRMLPQVFDILFLLLLVMIFWAWFGTVMFVGTDEGIQHFSNLMESLWTLWICVTTANYPDVMMPGYNQNRWIALYFISFMIISFFFLMNVVLAVVVNEYDVAVTHRNEDHSRLAQTNLNHAFRLLDTNETNRIDRKTVMALFFILNEDFPEIRKISHEDTKLLFAILDKDGSNTITVDEFLDFGLIMCLEFVKESDYETVVQRYIPQLYHTARYQRFCSAVQSNHFEFVIDVVLVLNAIVIGIQSYPELSGQQVTVDPKYFDGSFDTAWEKAETLFTLIYCIEIIVKVLVLGWKRYIESYKNMFDFTITMLALFSAWIVYYPNDFSDSRLIRMIVMARVLRLVRLLMVMKRFQLIGRITAEIIPIAASAIVMLLFLMYFFAAMGMELYGGIITRDPTNPLSYRILNSSFSENAYWANNFNDMLSGMNVLFNLLVINNWTNCEIGFELVTQSKWVRLFFLSFHILGVVLINNLVIALIINSFLEQVKLGRFSESNDERVGNSNTVIRGNDHSVLFDGSHITGTETSLMGGYIARLRKTANTDHMDRGTTDKDRLRLLFTQTSSELKEATQVILKKVSIPM